MHDSQLPSHRRLWPVLVPFALVVALAILWTGLWFYAASAAKAAIADWRVRETRAGRLQDCGAQSIGGFPFRIEVRCARPSLELRGARTPIVLKAADLLVAAQIYQPTLLISEFKGPMTVTAAGQAPDYTVNWTLGEASVRGTPEAPQRASFVVDNPTLVRAGKNVGTPIFKARHAEFHVRIAAGSSKENPVLDLALRAAGATAAEVAPLAASPFDIDVVATLHGLTDLVPKPWPVRLREIQARGGRIDIAKARLQQGDVIAVTTGSLRLSDRGDLQGQLETTVVGLESLLRLLGVDQIVSHGQVAAAIDSLDQLMPGLGALARQNAGPSIVAGLGAIGKRTVLEGKPAVTLPLRFADGRIMLGPFAIGRTPPLF